MRITIESRDDNSGAEVVRRQDEAAPPGESPMGPGAIDAGPPPEELVAAVAEAGGGETARSAEDAGPAPSE